MDFSSQPITLFSVMPPVHLLNTRTVSLEKQLGFAAVETVKTYAPDTVIVVLAVLDDEGGKAPELGTAAQLYIKLDVLGVPDKVVVGEKSSGLSTPANAVGGLQEINCAKSNVTPL